MDKVYELTLKLKNLATKDLDKFARQSKTITNKVSAHFKKMAAFIKQHMLAIAAGIAAIAYSANKLLNTFEKFETALVDMGKVTGRSLGVMRKEIMDLPAILGSATEMMKGYYQVISAGVTDPVAAIKLLVGAAKAANAAHVDQAEVIKGLTKVMRGYGGELGAVSEAADLLFAMEKEGQTTVAELIPVIGGLAKMSAETGVSINEMGAALSLMTQTSGDTAEAATQYRMVLMSILKPMGEMEKALEALNYESGVAMVRELGLAGAFKKLTAYMRENNIAIGDMFESQRGLLGLISLMERDFGAFEDKIKEVAKKTGMADKAFQDWSKTMEATKKVFWNTLGKVLIELGERLAPLATKAMKDLSDEIVTNKEIIISYAEDVTNKLKKLYTVLKDIIGLASKLPGGAAELGIVGFLLFRGKVQAAVIVASIVAINDALKPLEMHLGNIVDTGNKFNQSMKNIWDVITGKRDWQTGDLKLSTEDQIKVNELLDYSVKRIIERWCELPLVIKDVIKVQKELNEEQFRGIKITKKMEAAYQAVLNELRIFVETKRKLEEDITDRIFELTHSETENLIYELDKRKQALLDFNATHMSLKVDEAKITEWYALELEKIHKDAAEKIKDQSETIWDDMADVFKTTFTDAVTNELKSLEDVWDMLWNRMKYKMVDHLGDMVVEWVKGIAKMQTDANMTVDMAHEASIEGLGMESGKFFEGSTQLFDKAVDKFGGAVSAVGMALPQIAAVYAIGKTIASFVPESTGWQGESGPKGYIQGMGEMGPVGATLGLFGLHPMGAGEKRHMERVLERVQEFYDEYNDIMEKEYGNLVDMVSDFNHLISSQHIEALEEMGHVSESQVGSLHAVAEALGVMKNEAETAFAVSVGSMRRMETSAKQLALVIPEAADKIGSMTEKMQKLFMEDFMEKFERGLMDVDTAVKQLVRSGMSQLDAQTLLLGEDYNELIVMLGGSIETIDKVSESFNEMYDTLDDFDKLIADLPDSFGEVKKSLQELSYGLRYFLNMTQSLINTMEDLTELPEILESMGKAIKEGDWDQAAKDLYKLQNIALEASSAFAQLGEALDYLNFAGLGAAFTGIGGFFAGLAGFLAVIRMIAEFFGVWDELLKGFQITFLQLNKAVLELLQFLSFGFLDFSEKIAEIDQQIIDLQKEAELVTDIFALWQEEIDKMSRGDLISNIADGLREWQDIINRFELGDIKADMKDLLEDVWYAKAQIERAVKEGWITEDQAIQATADLEAAMAIQINAYFDALLEGFHDFRDQLKRDMQELSAEGRTAEDVWADMKKVYEEMGGFGGYTADMDPNEYLAHASEMRDLILERYAIEKEKILDLKDTILDLANQIDALRDKQKAWSDDIQGMIDQISGGKGEGAEQLTYWQNIIAGLQQDLAGASTLEEKEGILAELRNSYQSMLSMVESLKGEIGAESYQLLVDNLVAELEALKAGGEEIYQNEMDVLQAQLDTQMLELEELTGIKNLTVEMLRADNANETLLENLNAKTAAELDWLDTNVANATETLEGMRNNYLSMLNLSITELRDALTAPLEDISGDTGVFLGGLTLVETAVRDSAIDIVNAINGINITPGAFSLGSRQSGGPIHEEGLYHLHPKEDVATPGFQSNVIDRLEKIESKQAANGGGDVYLVNASPVKMPKSVWRDVAKKVIPEIKHMPRVKIAYDKQILKWNKGE